MGKTYVTNMNDQLDDSGELSNKLSRAALKIASFNTPLIDEATQALPADDYDSRIRCWAESCTGSVRVTLLSKVENLAWHCPRYGLNGVISHWQGTEWNRTAKKGG